MNDKNFDDGIIDPEENAAALAEAMGQEIREEVTILELLTKDSTGRNHRVKVRYIPQSIASSLDYDDGQTMQNPNSNRVRRPKFDFKKWSRERIPKMNSLALLNIQIKNDLVGEKATEKGDILLSRIGSGEFFRLEGLCFPGASEDATDSEIKDNVPRRKGGKGLRVQPTDAGE